MLPLAEFLQEKKTALFKYRSYTPVKAVSLLKPLIRSMEQALSNYPEYKARLTQILNATISVKEGLESGEITTDEVIELAKDYRRLQEFVVSWEAAKELKEEKKKQRQVEQDVGNDSLMRMTTESAPVLKKYALYKDDLPKFINTHFTVKRMPIIPLTIKAFNLEKLKAAKLATDHITFYPVLLNQLILGLNPRWVKEEFKGKQEDAAKYVLEMVELKRGSKHLIIGNPHGFNGSYWFWIPSTAEVRKLTAATYSGSLSVKKWGFPFQE